MTAEFTTSLICQVGLRRERRKLTGLLLRAVLFDDASLPEVAAALAAIPGVSQVEARDYREQGAPARIEFRLASKRGLPQVARLEGVRWIEEVAEQIENNGNTAGTLQSGTPGTVPVWDRESTARGKSWAWATATTGRPPTAGESPTW